MENCLPRRPPVKPIYSSSAIRANILSQIRECVRNSEFELAQLLPLVTANTARALKLNDRGKLEPQMKADVLVLERDTLELKEVIARGRRLLKDGKPVGKGTQD